jgi:hypothetical protein
MNFKPKHNKCHKLVDTFNLWDVVGHDWNFNMGGGVHPTKCMSALWKDENLVEAIWANILAYVKPLKVAWGASHWTLKSNKRNQAKEIDSISTYHDSKIIHGWYIS